MKTIIFDDEINSKSIEKLIDNIRFTDENNIEIYFTTGGGFTHCANNLIDFINNNNKNIIIKASGGVQSAGFSILVATNCKKEILDTAWGMIHKVSCDSVSQANKNLGRVNRYIKKKLFKKKDSIDDLQSILDDELNLWVREYREIGLSEEKISLLLQGKDVYIRNSEMKEIFKSA